MLVVEDEENLRFMLVRYLATRGLDVTAAENCHEAEQRFRSAPPDAVVTDFRLPDGEAIGLIQRLRRRDATIPILVLTGHGTIDLAVRTLKQGAEDFLTKPIEWDALFVALERALERRTPKSNETKISPAAPPFVRRSGAMQAVWEQLEAVAAAECPVLILGETGTGKSLLARWLHDHGPRAEGPFVDVNCAALPREIVDAELFGHERGAFTGAHCAKSGLFEAANKGTLFLDEIGDIDLAVQPKILKALEEKRFRRVGDVRERTSDVRLVSATHRDLAAATSQRTFRADLYYRICTVSITVPPLRDRPDDIAAIARDILASTSLRVRERPLELGEDAELALSAHSWPGNIRELKNVIERAVLRADGDVVTAQDLRFDPVSCPALDVTVQNGKLTMRELERQHLETVLREEGGRVEAAARRLGIPRSTMYQKLKAYAIQPPRTSKIFSRQKDK